MINIRNLYKRFGKLPVLTGLDLDIKQGGISVILGPNGSGKTTLIKSILGMVIPDQGEISIGGQNVLRKWEYRDDVDYLPQIANFPGNLTVSELIKLVRSLRKRASSEQELIRRFELEPFLGKKLGHLSGGTKQKVNAVLAFMYESPLIILDEPTNGLDPIALISLKELIEKKKEEGKTILITTHIMSFVEEVADQIVFLLDGKIFFQGGVEELKQKTGHHNLERAIAGILREKHV